MKIKKQDIEILVLLTKDLKLNARESRFRTRFNKILLKHLQEVYYPERIETITYFALKDENGEVIKDEKGNFTIPPENVDAFSVEIANVENEIFTIETNDDNKQMFETVYSILTSETMEVVGEYADVHDEVCEELERVIEHYNLKETE